MSHFCEAEEVWSSTKTDDDGSCCRFIGADLDSDEINYSPLFVVLLPEELTFPSLDIYCNFIFNSGSTNSGNRASLSF